MPRPMGGPGPGFGPGPGYHGGFGGPPPPPHRRGCGCSGCLIPFILSVGGIIALIVTIGAIF